MRFQYDKRSSIIKSSLATVRRHPPGWLCGKTEAAIRNQKRTAIGLAALVAIAASAYWIRSRGSGSLFDWSDFAATFTRLRLSWVAAGSILCLATYYVRALRWAVLLKPVSANPRVPGLLSATIVGYTAIVLLGRPGEFVRPYLISLKERVSFSSQLAAWMIERIYDLLAALLIFGFGLSQVRASGAKVGPGIAWVIATGGWAVAILGTICLGILVFIGRFADTARRRLSDSLTVLPDRYRLPATQTMNAFLDGAASSGSQASVVLLVLYTALEWILIAAAYYAILGAYGPTLQFGVVDVLIFMGFVSFGAVVQIPGIGGGVQLVATLVLTELFGLPVEIGASVAFLIWIATFITVVPFGVFLAFYEGWNWKQLKSAREEATL